MFKAILFSILCLGVIGAKTSTAQYSKDINQLRAELARTTDPRERFFIYDEIGLNLYYRYGNADTVVKAICDSMITLGHQLGNDSFLSRAFLLLDVYYGYTGNNRLTLKAIDSSIFFAKEACYWDALSSAYKEHAIIYKDLGFYDKALEKLKKALAVLPKKSDRLNYMQPNRLYYNLSDVYLRMDSPVLAKYYIGLADQVTLRDKDPYGYARVLDMQGKVNARFGDTDLANTCFIKAIRFCESAQLYYPLVTISVNYCRMLLAGGHHQMAKPYALLGYKYACYINNKSKVVDLASLLKEVYSLSKNTDSMYAYLVISDSVRRNMDSARSFNQIFNSVRDDEKDEQRELAEKESKEQNIQYVAISVGVLAFIIMFFSLSRTIIVNRRIITFLSNVAFLMFFELINLIIHAIIPHGTAPYLMFVLLVVIASVLLPLHHQLQQSITKKLVENNDRIRFAAAERTISEFNSGKASQSEKH